MGSGRRWLARAVTVLVAALVLAMAAVLALPLGRQPVGQLPAPVETPTPPPIPTQAPTPEPVTVEAALIDLADLAWWEMERGVAGAGEPAVDRLRIGTLDGRLAADLALASGAFAGGPYGPLVLAGQDDGTISEVFLVSVEDGTRRQVLLSDGIVPVASVGADGSVYFIHVDRGSGLDDGLWRLPPDGGAQELAAPGPLVAEALPGDAAAASAIRWAMAWAPDGTVIAVQRCDAEDRCVTQLVDISAAIPRSQLIPADHPVGPLVGLTDHDLVARAPAHAPGEVIAVERSTLAWRTLLSDAPAPVLLRVASAWVLAAEAGGAVRIQPISGPTRPWEVPAGSSDAPLMPPAGSFGSPLPNGWMLRWPLRAAAGRDAGALVNVVSGQEIEVADAQPQVERPDCQFIPPRQLPSGAAPGPHLESFEGGVRYARWSRGPDRIVQATGAWIVGSPDELPPDGVHEVRGQPARIVLIGDESTGEIALVWEEGGCPYTVWLAPGTFFVDAEDYARRY